MDTALFRRSWQAVLAGGLTVFTTAAVTLVVGLDDAASADTYVSAVTRAVIALPDGSEKPAKIGALVPHGAQVRTGQGGGARLTTSGRDVYVGALSSVRVLDGVREVLDKGLVMVDTRSGPRLSLRTKAGTVAAPSGALVRVEQNIATLRVAVYDGASAVTAADRRATTSVPTLHQVRVPYGGVPLPTTALALTVQDGSYDPWEQRLASNLVQADIDLNGFASGLNGGDGLAVLRAVSVSFSTVLLPGRTRGEQALAVAVAQKARLHKALDDNLAEVEKDRGDGGSWGVVAAIVRARVTDVTGVLSTTLPQLAQGPGTVVVPTASAGVAPSGGPSVGPTSPPTSTKTPTATPTRSATPSPSPNVVGDVVRTVLKLVPTPTPSPLTAPVSTPTRLLQIGPIRIG